MRLPLQDKYYFLYLESPSALDIVETNVEGIGGRQERHQSSLLKLVHHDGGVRLALKKNATFRSPSRND